MRYENWKESFWNYVDKDNSKDCWEWKGSLQTSGYGNSWNGISVEAAHRVSYKINCGKIPKGIHVCHHCDNRSCVNPTHLFLGTPKDHMKDCSNKNRLNKKSLKNLKKGVKFKKGHVCWQKGNRIYNFCPNCGIKVRVFKSNLFKCCSNKCGQEFRWAKNRGEIK